MTAKLDPAQRRALILDEAVRQAARVGYSNIRRDDVAAALDVSPALLNAHFSTMAQLKRDVMRVAVSHATRAGVNARPEWLRVIAQGIAMHDRHACRAPDYVKQAALAALGA